MVQILLVQGDITRVPADGLVTTTNGSGHFDGAVDRAIIRVGDDKFHRQLKGYLPEMVDGSSLAVWGRHGSTVFQSVVFVMDQLGLPLREVIAKAFELADRNPRAMLHHLTLPILRTGAVLEASRRLRPNEDPYLETLAALRTLASRKTLVQSVTVVAYDAHSHRAMHEALQGVGLL